LCGGGGSDVLDVTVDLKKKRKLCELYVMKDLQKTKTEETFRHTPWKTEYACRIQKLGQSLDDGVEAAGSNVLDVTVDLKKRKGRHV